MVVVGAGQPGLAGAGSDPAAAVFVSVVAQDCFSMQPSAAGTTFELAVVAAAVVVVVAVADQEWRMRPVPAAHQACKWGRSAVSGTCKKK